MTNTQRTDIPTIVYVEDNSGDALLLEEALREKGHATHLLVLDNGEKALRYFEIKDKAGDLPPPHCVLLDSLLPIVCGAQLLRFIRSSRVFDDTPVYIFSASADYQDLINAKIVSPESFITKSNSWDGFLNLADLLMRSAAAKQEGTLVNPTDSRPEAYAEGALRRQDTKEERRRANQPAPEIANLQVVREKNVLLTARFFMAEDNPGGVLLMEEVIKEVGLAVDIEVATDGAQAIARLLDPRHEIPDLIILNFNLPKFQGHEVLTAIKKSPRLLGIPVVMLTSSNAQRDRLLCQTADAYFVKSGDWEILVQIVRHMWDLINTNPSKRPTTQGRLVGDHFWKQGNLGPQGTGEHPIANLDLTKATERKQIGEFLDDHKGD